MTEASPALPIISFLLDHSVRAVIDNNNNKYLHVEYNLVRSTLKYILSLFFIMTLYES